LRRSLETVGAESSFAAAEASVTVTETAVAVVVGGSGFTLERAMSLSFCAGVRLLTGEHYRRRLGVERGGGKLRLGFGAPWRIFQL